MLTTFIRTIIMYFFVVLMLRLLGKRQIGELEPSELVVTIVISEVAALPISDVSAPLSNSLVAIFLLLFLEVVLSFSAFKCLWARKLFYGTPSVFYEKGKINQKEMKKQRFNLNDLMECVRNTGMTSLSDVDFVIMETNGNVSVIPTQPQSDEQETAPSSPFISYVIIDNGKINENNLSRLGFDKNWLIKQLEKRKIKKPDEVFCMTADMRQNTVIIPFEKEKKGK